MPDMTLDEFKIEYVHRAWESPEEAEAAVADIQLTDSDAKIIVAEIEGLFVVLPDFALNELEGLKKGKRVTIKRTDYIRNKNQAARAIALCGVLLQLTEHELNEYECRLCKSRMVNEMYGMQHIAVAHPEAIDELSKVVEDWLNNQQS